jgi:molybdopterin/thiamine biosynthesis adenylyltransferase
MRRIAFAGTSYGDMSSALLLEERETCALLLASQSSADVSRTNLLVREIHPAPDDAYAVRTDLKAQLRPDFLVPLVKRAREEKLSVIFTHTHPFAEGPPSFSPVDDAGEKHLSEFMARRAPNVPHAALVVGADGCAARSLGSKNPFTVVQVGAKVEVIYDPSTETAVDERWDRQVRAFGEQGQLAIRRAKVAIVGVGGTGSVVAEQLAHLGVSDFLLIDPDIVDETNLNRLVGATTKDVGKKKTATVGKHIRRVNPKASVKVLARDVTDLDVADALTEVDAIFGCTDSHASRAILNQLAYQYYVPLFDVGVGIVAKQGRITNVSGRTQMVSPGLPCLVCGGVIDAAAVRRELQTAVQRAADPYITGFNEPQPAVISLNSTMASLMVTMFMAAFTPVPGAARLQYYNGITGVVRAATLTADPSCIVCSRSGALGLGNEWSLPGRLRAS